MKLCLQTPYNPENHDLISVRVDRRTSSDLPSELNETNVLAYDIMPMSWLFERWKKAAEGFVGSCMGAFTSWDRRKARKVRETTRRNESQVAVRLLGRCQVKDLGMLQMRYSIAACHLSQYPLFTYSKRHIQR